MYKPSLLGVLPLWSLCMKICCENQSSFCCCFPFCLGILLTAALIIVLLTASRDRSCAGEQCLFPCSVFLLRVSCHSYKLTWYLFLIEFGLVLRDIIWKGKSPRDFICKRSKYLSMSSNIVLVPVLTPGAAGKLNKMLALKLFFMLTIEDCHWDFFYVAHIMVRVS